MKASELQIGTSYRTTRNATVIVLGIGTHEKTQGYSTKTSFRTARTPDRSLVSVAFRGASIHGQRTWYPSVIRTQQIAGTVAEVEASNALEAEARRAAAERQRNVAAQRTAASEALTAKLQSLRTNDQAYINARFSQAGELVLSAGAARIVELLASGAINAGVAR